MANGEQRMLAVDLHGDNFVPPQGIPLDGTGYVLVPAKEAGKLGLQGESPDYRLGPVRSFVKDFARPLMETAIAAAPAAAVQTLLQKVKILPRTRQEAFRKTGTEMEAWLIKARSAENSYWQVVNDMSQDEPVALAIHTLGPQRVVNLFGELARDNGGTPLVSLPGVVRPKPYEVEAVLREEQTPIVQHSGAIEIQPTKEEARTGVELSMRIRMGEISPLNVGPFIRQVQEAEVRDILADIGNTVALRIRHDRAEELVTQTIEVVKTTRVQQLLLTIMGAGVPSFQTMLGRTSKVLLQPYDIYQSPGEVPISVDLGGKEPREVGPIGSTAVGPNIVDSIEVGFMPTTKENRDARETTLTKLAKKIHGRKTEQIPIGEMVWQLTGTQRGVRVMVFDARDYITKWKELVGRRAALWNIARGQDGLEGKIKHEVFLASLVDHVKSQIQTRLTRAQMVQIIASSHIQLTTGLPTVDVFEQPNVTGASGYMKPLDVYARGGMDRKARNEFYTDFMRAYSFPQNRKILREAMGDDMYKTVVDDLEVLDRLRTRERGERFIDQIMQQSGCSKKEAVEWLIERRQLANDRLYGDIDMAEAEARRTATT